MSKFEKVAADVAKIVAEKNKSYGDSFRRSGEIMKILYPNGVSPDQYGDFLALIRIVDKQFRIATQKDAFGEDPWKDILGYALNAVTRNVEATEAEKPAPTQQLYVIRHPVSVGAGKPSYISHWYSDNGADWTTDRNRAKLLTSEEADAILKLRSYLVKEPA